MWIFSFTNVVFAAGLNYFYMMLWNLLFLCMFWSEPRFSLIWNHSCIPNFFFLIFFLFLFHLTDQSPGSPRFSIGGLGDIRVKLSGFSEICENVFLTLFQFLLYFYFSSWLLGQIFVGFQRHYSYCICESNMILQSVLIECKDFFFFFIAQTARSSHEFNSNTTAFKSWLKLHLFYLLVHGH